MKIVTDYWRKPIPTDRFDWSATSDNYEPGDPIGYGRTEAEAIADLKAQYEIEEGDIAQPITSEQNDALIIGNAQ